MKLSKKNDLHLTLEVGNGLRTHHTRVSASLVRAFKILKWTGICSFLLFWVQLASFGVLQYSIYMEESRHELLKNELSQHAQEIREQEKLAEHFFEQNNQLALYTGVNGLGRDEFAFGVGGPLNSDSLAKRIADPALKQKLWFDQNAERILGKFSMSAQAMKELYSVKEQQLSQLKNIPSIKPAKGYFSSGFGHRTHPVTGAKGTLHAGLDIANAPWTPIYAAADGVVEVSKTGPALGTYIKIDHGNGYTSVYGHLKKSIVRTGQVVKRNEQIGHMGNSGRSTGTHLHYEIRQNGNHLNPRKFILPSDQIID